MHVNPYLSQSIIESPIATIYASFRMYCTISQTDVIVRSELNCNLIIYLGSIYYFISILRKIGIRYSNVPNIIIFLNTIRFRKCIYYYQNINYNNNQHISHRTLKRDSLVSLDIT